MVDFIGFSRRSYAKRAAGYLMAYGMPKAGDYDHRPANLGKPWREEDVALTRCSVLWLALTQPIPDTGSKLSDIFAGKELDVIFRGDPKDLIEETEREQFGQPFSGEQFTMMVAVVNENYA